MARAYNATYTNHDGEGLSLNDSLFAFALGGLPQNIYVPIIDPLRIDIPSQRPAALFQLYNTRPREIPMMLQTRGTLEQVAANVAYMMDVFQTDITDHEQGVFTYTAENEVTRAIRCSLSAFEPVTEWIARYRGSTDALAKIALSFVAEDPCFYDPTETSAGPATLDAGTPVTLSCTNYGNADAWLTIDAAGPIDWLRITDAHGHVFTVEGDLETGDALHMVLDPRDFAVTYTPTGGGADQDWRHLTTGAFPLVAPATHDLTFVSAADTPAGTGTVDVTYAHTYAFHGLAARS